LNNGGVVVIGELNVDLVATGLAGPPRLGAEIVAADFELTLGSASAIFACGVAKLGHSVTFISQVGRDDFGEFCLKALRAARVPTDNVLIDKRVKTGVTISLSTRTDRALVTYPGAIASFNYGQLKMAQLKGQRHLHMTSYFLQEGLRPSFPQIFREAKRTGLTTSFDPNSDPEQAWGGGINEVLAQTDVLFLNETEAREWTRARGVRRALKILGQAVPCAVIKLGRKGAVAIKDGEVVSAPGFKVEALDTTGAGDCFAAGFVSTYLRGRSLAECLRAGNACGALSTLKAGGTAGQPDARTLKAFLKAEDGDGALKHTAPRGRR
jgi:sugar/nucleoside kinase (ribokinase family)